MELPHCNFSKQRTGFASFSRNKQKSEVGFWGIEEGSIILPYPASIHERENSQKQNFFTFFLGCLQREKKLKVGKVGQNLCMNLILILLLQLGNSYLIVGKNWKEGEERDAKRQNRKGRTG